MGGATTNLENVLDVDKIADGLQVPDTFEKTFEQGANRQILVNAAKEGFSGLDNTEKKQITDKAELEIASWNTYPENTDAGYNAKIGVLYLYTSLADNKQNPSLDDVEVSYGKIFASKKTEKDKTIKTLIPEMVENTAVKFVEAPILEGTVNVPGGLEPNTVVDKKDEGTLDLNNTEILDQWKDTNINIKNDDGTDFLINGKISIDDGTTLLIGNRTINNIKTFDGNHLVYADNNGIVWEIKNQANTEPELINTDYYNRLTSGKLIFDDITTTEKENIIKQLNDPKIKEVWNDEIIHREFNDIEGTISFTNIYENFLIFKHIDGGENFLEIKNITEDSLIFSVNEYGNNNLYKIHANDKTIENMNTIEMGQTFENIIISNPDFTFTDTQAIQLGSIFDGKKISDIITNSKNDGILDVSKIKDGILFTKNSEGKTNYAILFTEIENGILYGVDNNNNAVQITLNTIENTLEEKEITAKEMRQNKRAERKQSRQEKRAERTTENIDEDEEQDRLEDERRAELERQRDEEDRLEDEKQAELERQRDEEDKDKEATNTPDPIQKSNKEIRQEKRIIRREERNLMKKEEKPTENFQSAENTDENQKDTIIENEKGTGATFNTISQDLSFSRTKADFDAKGWVAQKTGKTNISERTDYNIINETTIQLPNGNYQTTLEVALISPEVAQQK